MQPSQPPPAASACARAGALRGNGLQALLSAIAGIQAGVLVGMCKSAGLHAGKANGVHKVWLNGRKIYDARDVVYRTTPESLVEIFTFRNFHGGKSDKFRPDATQYAWCARHVHRIAACRTQAAGGGTPWGGGRERAWSGVRGCVQV